MIVTIASFELKRKRMLPTFLRLSLKILEQAKTSPGNLKAQVEGGGIQKFYSFTHWKNKESMINFIHTGFHAEGLAKNKNLCKEAKFLYFENNEYVDFNNAKKMLEESTKTRVISFKQD